MVALAFLALAGCRENADGARELRDLDSQRAAAATASAVVRYVIDGDTVELEDGTRVRILLVDAPEATGSTECFGEEATQFTQDLLAGRAVRMTSDVVQTDRYGRALRYIEVHDQDVSAALVGGGYACVLHVPPNGQGRVERLRRLQEAARTARRGLWGACTDRPC